MQGRVSTKRMTRSALLRPGAAHGCGSDEAGGAADERFFGVALMPLIPMRLVYQKSKSTFDCRAVRVSRSHFLDFAPPRGLLAID